MPAPGQLTHQAWDRAGPGSSLGQTKVTTPTGGLWPLSQCGGGFGTHTAVTIKSDLSQNFLAFRFALDTSPAEREGSVRGVQGLEKL